MGIYRTSNPVRAKCTFFLRAHGTFSRTSHMLAHKTRVNKFKKTEIMQIISSNHNGIKLEFNNRKKTRNLKGCEN